jgi:AraC-like DNA-binding protein
MSKISTVEPAGTSIGQIQCRDSYPAALVAYRSPHSLLRHLIAGYHSFYNPKLIHGDRSFTAPCSGTLYLHIFQEDIPIEITSGQKTIRSVFPGIMGGQYTKPMHATIGKTSRTISIEFLPIAMPFFFDVSVPEITDDVVSTNDLPDKSFRILVDNLRHQTSMDEHKNTLDNFFLSKSWKYEDVSFFHRCIAPIFGSSGRIAIGDIQKQFDFSTRQFERKFKESAGVSATVLKRFIRSNCALSEMLKQKTIHDTVYNLGYFDQSHLIKDIKWYTGKTPLFLSKECKNAFFRLGNTTYILG